MSQPDINRLRTGELTPAAPERIARWRDARLWVLIGWGLFVAVWSFYRPSRIWLVEWFGQLLGYLMHYVFVPCLITWCLATYFPPGRKRLRPRSPETEHEARQRISDTGRESRPRTSPLAAAIAEDMNRAQSGRLDNETRLR